MLTNYLEFIQSLITTNFTYVSFGLISLFLIATILFMIVIYRLNKLNSQYKKMMTGVNNRNLEDIMVLNAEKLGSISLRLTEIEENNERIGVELNKCLKNIGVVRYNAFENMGSDLSFSVAMLDTEAKGFVLTGIHGREDSRTYIKPIIEGQSTYNLSNEEIEAIKKALAIQ